MKKTVLLWSGGFDSTALLLSIVTNPKEFPNVTVIGCGLKNANNYAEDRAARAKILDIIKADAGHVKFFEHTEISIEAYGTSIQGNLWAYISAINVSSTDDEIEFMYGFIRGDDFWHYRHHFEQSVRSLVAIHAEDTKIKFRYPLEWKYKKEFLSWYIHHQSVFDSISWGGDTEIVKAKEKDELTFMYYELLSAKNIGLSAEKKIAQCQDTEDLYTI